MTKFAVLISCVTLVSCGGSLSDEQRKAMREKMEINKIVRITEAELTEAAFAEGRKTVRKLDSLTSDSSTLLAYLAERQGSIRFITPASPDAHILEKQLIDAYLSDSSGASTDNVQKVRRQAGDFDTLLYTQPVTKKLEDGSEELVGVWNIWISKKELVLDMGRGQ